MEQCGHKEGMLAATAILRRTSVILLSRENGVLLTDSGLLDPRAVTEKVSDKSQVCGN